LPAHVIAYEQKADEYSVPVARDFIEFISDFLEDILQDAKAMGEALKRKDYDVIADMSHSIKGAGGGYGLDRISDLARSIETAAKNKRSEKLDALLDDFIDYITNLTVTSVD